MNGRSRGVFTLSLDCEGLWGMADNAAMVSSGAITDASLAEAYEVILRALGQNELVGTAAFVSAFACEETVLRENLALFDRLDALDPKWFSSIVSRLKTGALDGWRGAKYYRAMAAAGHEMAWHGATHQSLWDGASEESIELELDLAERLFETLGQRPETVVFPRNCVGHLPALKQAGFKTYRDSPGHGMLSRMANLLGELNAFAGCEMVPAKLTDGWRVCRPGNFLNWPSGARAVVPLAVTIARWKSMLRDAAQRGGHVHMWFHPHNLITAPAMRDSFEAIIGFAGELTRTGDLTNLTMAQSVCFPNDAAPQKMTSSP
ncbi:MAG: polysaccharide deacetylase family protein [Methylocystis sp.]